jgi:GT2 family glycosyltransferase
VRPIEIDGLDHPRSDWTSSPAIRLMMELGSGRVEGLKATIKSLRAQAYRNWSLHAVRTRETPADLLAAFREEMAADPRLRELASGENLFSNSNAADRRDFVANIEVGDLIPIYAFAVIVETIARWPSLRIVYGDEDAIAANGNLHSPVFKPDWSPILFRALPYLGRLVCMRSEDLRKCEIHTVADFVHHENRILKRVAAMAAAGEIHHIRRILYRRQREATDGYYYGGVIDNARHVQPEPEADKQFPVVTIIVPTRDRADLLAQCMKGLREITDYPAFDVVIVDNGSVEADAIALLQELGSLPRFKVVSRPGKFNFSALCNDGARLAKTSILVFLNNDVMIFDSAWLKTLVAWALQSEIGVIGAKLLFPNNTIEHVGVVLGHGGLAGHIYPGQPASEPGHLRELTVAHEVTAVTGACFAMQREKFEAVGGFDAKNLPVDLNDIDLCLKIAEHGWKIVWTPKSVLYHMQSASRGFPIKPFKLYQKEREYFRQRWSQVIRDDPYFHPALSLFSHKPALA